MLEVQRFASERRIKALDRMEAKRLEAKLRQEAELQQEADIQQEAEIRRPEVKTTEKG